MLRIILLTCGWCALGLAMAGLVIPLLPATPFALLAAACFARSSPACHTWLVRHRWFGPLIAAYRDKTGLPMTTKIRVLALVWTSLGASMTWGVPDHLPALRWTLGVIGCGVTWSLLRLPTLRPVPKHHLNTPPTPRRTIMAFKSPRTTIPLLVVGLGLLGLGIKAFPFSADSRFLRIKLTESSIEVDGETWVRIARDTTGAPDLENFDTYEAGRVFAANLEPDHLQKLPDSLYAIQPPQALDSTLHLRTPLLLTASPETPLLLLDAILASPDNFDPDRRDTVLLAIESSRAVRLQWGSAREDSGAHRCLLLEDEFTSYFEGATGCDSLRFAIPTGIADQRSRMRDAVLATRSTTHRRRLEIHADLRIDAPLERLGTALWALDIEQEPLFASYTRASGFKRFAGGLRRIRLKGQGKEWLTQEELRTFVPGFVAPLGSSASGIRLVGMERVLFDSVDARDLAVDAPDVLALLPLSSKTKVRVERPEHAPDSWEPDDLTWKDFQLPPVLEGHAFVLRQVVYHPYTLRNYPIWWALYDNGRRTSIWTWSGGLGYGRVLPNYELRQVVGGKDGRFALRLQADNYRRSFSTEKGVEFAFQATPTGLVLGTARTAWGYFDGDGMTVATESVQGDSMLERSLENASDRRLKACGFTNPRRDEEWTWDWNRLAGTAKCLVGGKGAVAKTRPLSRPSYLEAGWDTLPDNLR